MKLLQSETRIDFNLIITIDLYLDYNFITFYSLITFTFWYLLYQFCFYLLITILSFVDFFYVSGSSLERIQKDIGRRSRSYVEGLPQ